MSFLKILMVTLFLPMSLFADNSWEVLDQFLEFKPLCQSFRDGSQYTFQRKSCLRTKCDVWNYQLKVKCGSDAILEFVKVDGVFSRTVLTSDIWRAERGNMLRIYAKHVESLSQKFTLTSLSIENGYARAEFEISNPMGIIKRGVWQMGNKSAVDQLRNQTVTNVGLISGTDQDLLIDGYHQ